MAIGLITEVMDWAPETLTHREHKVLMILAEDARADSRVTWQSVESPQMLRRVRLSRTQLYMVVAALVAKGCLEPVMQGGKGHVAKYRIPVLAPPFSVPETGTLNPSFSVPETGTLNPSFSVPENVTQNPAVQCPGNRDAEPLSVPVLGASVSLKPGPLALKGPLGQNRVGQIRVGGEADDKEGLGLSSAANSQNPRVHHGSEDPASDVQQSRIPVTLQSPAAGRNARTRGAS